MTEYRPSLPNRCPGEALRELSEPDTIRHTQTPRPPAAAGTPRVERLRAFTEVIVGLHQVAPGVSGFIPMCSCGMPARHCAVLKAEHEVLGVPMPFSFGPPRPPYYEV